jgi:deazaflavin-dependent oxidoreductase (nitroreductase family)
MRIPLILATAAAAAVAAAIAWWRRHPRVGAAYVNRVVDPWLVRRGILDRTHGEIGLIEHVGRRTGVVRVSPVHPVATDDGFRIIVPLGFESQWARNVLAAGRCRIQLDDTVHDLERPSLVAPTDIAGLPVVLRRAMTWLGFRFLVLHRVGHHAGTLGHPVAPVEVKVPAA